MKRPHSRGRFGLRCCALEALFVPGAGDDHIALAEPDTRSLGAVLVPQARDLRLDRGVLGYELRIVAERKRAKQLASVLGELLDLGPYVI